MTRLHHWPPRARSERPVDDVPMNRDTWMAQGACASMPPRYDLFFPEEPEKNKRREALQLERQAKSICAICPVAWECLDFSIRETEIHGIWGGMTFPERCDFTLKYRGHTSPSARAAHRRYLTDLNRKPTPCHLSVSSQPVRRATSLTTNWTSKVS